ncbi:hypothetical protein OIU92_22225 [Escherichia coli]|nr:hypothetical protein [Escherichia coli]
MIHSPASKVKSEIIFHDTFSGLRILPSGLQGRRGFVINYIFSSAKLSQKHDCRQIDIFRLVITEYGLALIPAPSAKEKLIQILFSISVI